MARSRSRFFVPMVGCAGLLALAGCRTIGPGTVARDRFDYNGEVSRSWKEQTLLNIVKSRYSDMPVFLDVAQIVSGYTLESSISLGANTVRAGTTSDAYSLGATGKWTDRPTITYSPLTGAQFNRSMLTPIPPAAVLFTMQAGWPIDQVFRITVRSINGVDSLGADNSRYERLVTLMRALQLGQVMGMRVQGEKVEQQSVFMFFRARALTAEQEAMVEEVRGILSLKPQTTEFRVVFGAVPASDGEIALLTRSMLQMLIDLGEYAEVPEGDVRDGRTGAGHRKEGDANGRLLRIRFSQEQPRDALVRVQYRGGWYWIDDRDMASKRTFALVMIFSTLLETGARESMPLVTIPAG